MKYFIKSGKLKAEERVVWAKILKSWINIHEIYYSQTKGDKAYYYNERASISQFAASIWKKGGVAIEEYKAKKIREDKKENGRVDLWFHLDEYSAIVEAKHLRRNVKEFSKKPETKKSQNKKIKQFLEAAMDDAKASAKVDNELAFGVVFIYLHNSSQEKIDLLDILLQIQESDCDFYACVKCGDLTDEYPAGVLIGKKYKKPRKKKS